MHRTAVSKRHVCAGVHSFAALGGRIPAEYYPFREAHPDNQWIY